MKPRVPVPALALLPLTVFLVASPLLLAGCASEPSKPKGDDMPPATVHDLAASPLAGAPVLLTWTAPGDDGTNGRATSYEVRYSAAAITAANWADATPVSSVPAPGYSGDAESLSVAGPTEGAWYFALKAADDVPNWSALSNVATLAVGDLSPPASVPDLRVVTTTLHSVTLAWTAPGDDGATGNAAHYELRYAHAPITSQNWGGASIVQGLSAPQPAGSAETFAVTGLTTSSNYFFALRAADEVSNWSAPSNVASTTIGVARVTQSPAGGNFGAVCPAWCPDGCTIAFYADWSAQTDLYTVGAGGGAAVRLTSHPSSDSAPAWSPDGQKIAFMSRRGGKNEIWVMNATPGAQATLLASHAQDLNFPAWSPDGERIAYEVDFSNPMRSAIYVVPAGGGEPQALVDDAFINSTVTWSPDGSQIAFQSNRRGEDSEIWVMPAAGGEATQLTDSPGWDACPKWSPDGTRIAFASDRSGNMDIWVMSSSGANPVQLTSDTVGAYFPSWSPDGSRIAFTSTRSGNGRNDIWVVQAN